MWSPVAKSIALPLLGIALYALRALYARIRRLQELSGPDNRSLFVGNMLDLRRAPIGTRWNVWQREYGATYRITGPLLVRGLTVCLFVSEQITHADIRNPSLCLEILGVQPVY
jgi:hypothetical protein